MEDFCDGIVFNQHAQFSSDPEALQIICYYDELELVNPLGAYVKKQKLGICFFMLGNIEPKYRSRLRSINLAIVCKATIVEKHGINKVLQPLVEDLNKLAVNGVNVSINDRTHCYKGSLLAFLGDTPASHLVGGFKKSVSFAYRPCRTCMATPDTLKVNFNSKMFKNRNPSDHENQCKKLVPGDPLFDYYSKIYGINEKSVLLDVKNFTMTDWGLPHDIMHDLFEGVVEYEIKVLLLHCLEKKFFTLEEFNRRLLDFDYGYTEVSDKPTPITSQHLRSETTKHLRQGSAQTWLLARILPLLIASSIPEDDDHWQCYLKLLNIIDICLSPIATTDVCGLLKVLIEEHHTAFKALYPNWSITPKMHYMIHYPEQILALGPLIRAWTMRLEAKLHILKCAGHVSNFKNITQTISHRHQRLMCYEFSAGGVFQSSLECGPCFGDVPLCDEPLLLRDQICNAIPDLNTDTTIHRTSWVKINGILYKTNNAYILCKVSKQDLAEPTFVFGCIEEIRIIGSTFALFTVTVAESQYFDDHYHAYVVKRTSDRLVVLPEALVDATVLHSRTLAGKLYINLKYNIIP